MESLKAYLSRLNWDSILAYSAPRMVRVRDWRLGLLQFALMGAIAIYIVGYDVVYLQRYRLLATDVSGSVKLLLKAAQVPYVVAAPNTTYCNGGYAPPAVGAALDCLFLDEYNLVYPLVENAAMFVTSRIKETSEALLYNKTGPPVNCSLTDPLCAFGTWPIGNEKLVYAGGPVEFATLSIQHAVYAASIAPYAWSSQVMSGRILGGSGAAGVLLCSSFSPRASHTGRPGRGLDAQPLRRLPSCPLPDVCLFRPARATPRHHPSQGVCHSFTHRSWFVRACRLVCRLFFELRASSRWTMKVRRSGFGAPVLLGLLLKLAYTSTAGTEFPGESHRYSGIVLVVSLDYSNLLVGGLQRIPRVLSLNTRHNPCADTNSFQQSTMQVRMRLGSSLAVAREGHFCVESATKLCSTPFACLCHPTLSLKLKRQADLSQCCSCPSAHPGGLVVSRLFGVLTLTGLFEIDTVRCLLNRFCKSTASFR